MRHCLKTDFVPGGSPISRSQDFVDRPALLDLGADCFRCRGFHHSCFGSRGCEMGHGARFMAPMNHAASTSSSPITSSKARWCAKLPARNLIVRRRTQEPTVEAHFGINGIGSRGSNNFIADTNIGLRRLRLWGQYPFVHGKAVVVRLRLFLTASYGLKGFRHRTLIAESDQP